jgi:hypothetical protein
MHKSKGSWAMMGLIVALVCFCAGVADGLCPQRPPQTPQVTNRTEPNASNTSGTNPLTDTDVRAMWLEQDRKAGASSFNTMLRF